MVETNELHQNALSLVSSGEHTDTPLLGKGGGDQEQSPSITTHTHLCPQMPPVRELKKPHRPTSSMGILFPHTLTSAWYLHFSPGHLLREGGTVWTGPAHPDG